METAATLNDSGIALTEANRPGEAIPLFHRALRMEPENPLLWTNLGIAWQRSRGMGAECCGGRSGPPRMKGPREVKGCFPRLLWPKLRVR